MAEADARRAELEADEKRRRRFGVFVWEAANMYRPADAIAVYRRESDADRRAEREPGRNLVVRRFLLSD